MQQDERLLLTLTSRENEVLKLIGAGYTEKAIARRLGVNDRTVRHYKHGINCKLGLLKDTDFSRVVLRVRAADRLVELEQRMSNILPFERAQ